jgi:hypothetical protein
MIVRECAVEKEDVELNNEQFEFRGSNQLDTILEQYVRNLEGNEEVGVCKSGK